MEEKGNFLHKDVNDACFICFAFSGIGKLENCNYDFPFRRGSAR